MKEIDPGSCRVETLIGALLYLMTAYQRGRRPDTALSVTAHLDCLARHPDAAQVVRQIAFGMLDEWRHAAGIAGTAPVRTARPHALN